MDKILLFLLTGFSWCTFVEGRLDTTARCMRTKCTVSKLNEELNSMRGADELVKVLSWNVERISIRTICKYVSGLKLEVIGLQRVTSHIYYRLQNSCLRNFNASGVPSNFRYTTSTFNPIFYKNDRQVNKEMSNGTDSSLTWTRLTFQMKSRRYRRGLLSQNLLAILKGRKVQNKYARAISRSFYRKQVFFVNVDLEENDNRKDKTLYKLLTRFYFKVMDRRRYRVILFGTVGSEKSSGMLKNFMKRRRRGSNFYFSMFRRTMTDSSPRANRVKNISNQIWQSNMRSRSFRSVLSAVINTNTRNKPTFSMFLM